MKHLNFVSRLRAFLTISMVFFMQLAILAQDAGNGGTSSTTTTTKTTTTNWYSSPWVWVLGAAVFILLLVALTRGGGSSRTSDRVSVTKTVKHDS